jgi:hypothetical protein
MAFIFIWLYELFIGPNFSDPTYREGIFLFVGLCMFTFPIALSALYYVVLNGNSSFAKLRYSKHWFMFMFLSILIVVGATLLISKAQTGSSEITAYMLSLSVVNIILTALVYTIASVIFKSFSLHAKYVPFDWLLIKR